MGLVLVLDLLTTFVSFCDIHIIYHLYHLTGVLIYESLKVIHLSRKVVVVTANKMAAWNLLS